MKRIVTFMLAISLCFLSLVILASAKDLEFDQDHFLAQNAKSAYFASSFKEKFTTIVVKKASQTTRLDFPNNYGGIYIDSNNKLHIQYIEDLDLISRYCNADNVTFEKVEFGYNYLNMIKDILSEKVIELSINCVYVSEVANKVIVCTNTDKDQICKVLDKQIGNFDQQSIKVEEPTTMANTDGAGQKIKCGSNIFTLGYNAYKASTGKYGFVTCGHAVNVGDNVKLTNFWGTKLGSVQNKQLYGSIDAAFVPYSKQSRATPTTIDDTYITGTRSSAFLTVGLHLYKLGSTTGLQEGYVTANSATVVCDGTTFTDQVQLDISQQPGDSGGPVLWSFIGPPAPGTLPANEIVGIATIASSVTWHTAYVSKAENINSIFGLSTYIAY